MVGHQESSTMAELRWIMMSSFLMLVFNSKAATEGYPSITVRDGDEATLPCGLEHNNNCSSVTWVFTSPGKTTITLYEEGKIHKDSTDKSDRLSVTEKCSLIITNIKMVDVGRYTCRYFGPSNIPVPESGLILNVVTMTEQTDKDTVTFTCSVSTYDVCRHTVKWLYVGHEETQSSCSDSVTLTLSVLSQTRKGLSCSVTDDSTREEHVFTYRLSQSSDVMTTTPTPTRTTTTTPTTTTTTTSTSTSTRTRTPKSTTPEGPNKTASENNQNGSKQQVCSPYCSVLGHFMLGLHVAEVLLMTVITVLLTRAAWNQRSPRLNTVNEDENESVVHYENTEDPHVSVRRR